MAHLTFPPDLPVPVDDGACAHLPDTEIPSVSLRATSGDAVDLSTLPGLTIAFCYPRTGAPDEVVPDSWNAIPGARGCTPQACSFRDLSKDLAALGVTAIYGISTQDTVYQKEVHDRIHLPYDLLSDENLELTKALKLPTFEWQGKTLIKRMALAITEGRIIKVWYPIFPPDKSAEQVKKWLEERK